MLSTEYQIELRTEIEHGFACSQNGQSGSIMKSYDVSMPERN